jgi:hypothetical protein
MNTEHQAKLMIGDLVLQMAAVLAENASLKAQIQACPKCQKAAPPRLEKVK